MSEAVEAKSIDTVTIEIDGQSLTAPKGAMIIEIADKAGIEIPRFCYHPKLSIAANCRMCLVDVEKAPKPLPACATPVMDGMRVYTKSKRTVSAQQGVMEFLLVNHPLDCPICDQGGECELQDLAMGYGKSVSRFSEGKRVVADENLGSLVSTDMTRCIHCTRCVRFLHEVAGTDELGGIGRGEHTKISTYIGRSIDSELSGNIIDLCPVGALTNKPFRFSARAWELRAKESISMHDSVGSNLQLHVLRGQIKRIVPKHNEAINEAWLADRDRYSHEGLYADDRLQQPEIKINGQWQQIDWETALSAAKDILQSYAKDNKLGTLVSASSSLEELYLLQKLVRGLGGSHIDHRLRQLDFTDQVSSYPMMEKSLVDFEQSDVIFLIGSNVRHDQPILAHRIRKAWKNGAKIIAINVLDYNFVFDVENKFISNPTGMVYDLASIVKCLVDTSDLILPSGFEVIDGQLDINADIKQVANTLLNAKSATILFGNYAQQHPNTSILRNLTKVISQLDNISYCEPGEYANSKGAWLAGCVPHFGPNNQSLNSDALNAYDMITTPQTSYLLYNVEPEFDHAVGRQAVEAVNNAEKVISIGLFASENIRKYSDILLPIGAFHEVDGSYINLEGKMQTHQVGAKIPGNGKPGWKILRQLGSLCGLDGFEQMSTQEILSELEIIANNHNTMPAVSEIDFSKLVKHSVDQLVRVGPVSIYDVDPIVRRAPALQATKLASNKDSIAINAADADKLGVEADQVIEIYQDGFSITLKVIIDNKVPTGCAYIPSASVASAVLGKSTGVISLAGKNDG